MTMDEELEGLITKHEEIKKIEMDLKIKAGRFQEEVTKFMADHFLITGEVSIMEIIKKVKART